MASLNKAVLLGNVGQDPEVRFMQSGAPVANLSVATSDTWTDKQSGQKRESTEWHRVVVFNQLAEICQKYLRKGSRVYLEGQIKTRKWQDRDGNNRYSTEVVLNGPNSRLIMLGGTTGGGGGTSSPGPSDDSFTPEPDDSDIPF